MIIQSEGVLKFFILSATILLLPVVFGQQYNFRNFNVEDGLGQSQVYAMCQEPGGSLWMGTRGGGVTVYDGVEFKSYTTNEGLANNYVNSIALGPDNTIWIGTNNGISYYEKGKFHTLRLAGNTVVRDIVFRANGEIRAATNKGILTVDKKSLSFGMIQSIEQPNVSCMVERDGVLWYGTNDGLFRRDKNSDYFLGKESAFMRNAITTISKDAQNNLWIGTYGDGMYCYDGKRFFRVDHQLELYRKTVLNIYIDGEDNLWLATLRSGVIHYNKSTKTFTSLTESEGLSNNHVRCILQDNSRQFWFGTSGGGVCQFLGRQFANFDTRSGLAGNFIYSVFRDSQGRLWVGNSQKGVSRYADRHFDNFDALNGFKDVKVKAIGEDREGTIWLGTDGYGVYIYKNDEFQPIRSLDQAYVKHIQSDAKGNIWIATAGSGLIRVTPRNDNYVVEKWGYLEGLLSNRITCLHFDKKGRLWYGTESNGIGCFDPKKEKVVLRYTADKKQIASDQIRTLTEDRFGRLWIGTAGKGLSVLSIYNSGQNPWNIRQHDGLKSDNIYLLTTDKEGNIISGTEKGIDYLFFRENGNIKQIKNYSNQDGFNGVETCQNSSWLDRDGTIWLGTINGLCRFNPAELGTNPIPPLLAFKDIKLFYESILTGDPDALSLGTKEHPLELGYSENHITFEFLGINLKRPESVQYQWQLIGFEDSWSPASKDRRIVYSNLNPGTYTFRIKACNEDGVWSPPISYTFTIDTPYWKTIWFRALVITAFVLILVLVYLITIKRIRKNARIKQREVEFEKDLLELEQKAMRLQMNPHFIFNALNSIQSLIGTGKETEARYFLAKFSRLMRQILDNSRKTSITLEEEIQTLENYLLIEQFCNGERFEYAISTDESLEQDFIHLPPMIIQPFVENAIKHGMRGMPEGAKKGRISISFRDSESMLECIVEDNGIGREKAAELNKESKETYHQSTALAVTTERLNHLKSEGIDTPLEIVDLYDNGVASGTRVIIRLPLE